MPPLLDIVSKCIEDNLRSEDKGLKERAVTLHVYVSKALALRGFPAMNSWLQRVCICIFVINEFLKCR